MRNHNDVRRARACGAAFACVHVAISILFLCGGCTTPESYTLNLAPAPRAVADFATATEKAPAMPAQGAHVRVINVIVEPVSEQNAGNVFGSRVIVSGLDERLLDGLRQVSSKTVRIDAALGALNGTVTASPKSVRVSFAKAYIHSVYGTKSAVVVLKMEHAGSTRYFRAQRTGLIWTAPADEYQRALIKALNEALGKLRSELLKLTNATS